MLRFRIVFAALLCVLPFSPADGCVLHLRLADATTLAWDAVDGAAAYQVQESLDSFATSTNHFVTTTTYGIARRASTSTKISYMVTALLSNTILAVAPSTETCTEQLAVTIPGDPQFRALTAKVVVPVAGSIAGAFGSRFKTSLKLTATAPSERGRIIFHPAAASATAADPWLAYKLDAAGDSVAFDDVIAALGASGLGSLDVVPDADAPQFAPSVDARLFNDTPAGTFGTAEDVVYPFDYLQAPDLDVTVPTGTFRVNVGLRTLTVTHAKALVYGTNGRLRTFTDLGWPADYTAFGTIQQVTGVAIAPGERLLVYFDGAAIPFYSLTENRSNDPELFVARPQHSNDVGSYVE